MPVQVEFTTAANSSNFTSGWFPLNVHDDVFSLAWHLNRSGAGGQHSLIEGTIADIRTAPVSAAVAFTLADVSSNSGGGATAAVYNTPITAVRITTSGSGTSNMSFRVLQVGI